MSGQHTIASGLMTHCRACNSARMKMFLAMGNHPPANMFVRPEDLDVPQPSWPLNAQVCLDCGLVQIADLIPRDFYKHYLYVPSGATTMHKHFKALAEVLVARAEGGLIVDIGCNDGLMLSFAAAQGGKVLGVDPAENIAKMAEDRGVPVHVAYFGPEVAAAIRAKYGPAQIIASTNTFNHIADLPRFVEAALLLLEDTGTIVVEVPWSKAILDKNQFDNIYHEHISEMSLRSIVELARRTGIEVVDVTLLPVHGGSMRVFLTRPGQQPVAAIVAQMLAEEDAAGVRDPKAYDAFAERVADMRRDMLGLLAELKASGAKIAGYGAPAKGNTMLNFFGIGPDTLDYLVDRNALKHGLYSPGQLIPVLPVETIAESKPDYLLVLAWNFFDEIRLQFADYEAAGGRFILPVPEPHVVGHKT